MKELLVLNPEHASEDEMQNYRLREAARAVALDDAGNVALLFASFKNYYKLPGGGLEQGEGPLVALERECREEIGCEIEVLKELGAVVEYRKIFDLRQISYCYLARVRGEKGAPQLTDGEIEDGFTLVWLPYEEALRAVAENLTADIEGKLYITPRDVAILKAAEKYMSRRS